MHGDLSMKNVWNGIAALFFLINVPASAVAGWDPNQAKEAQEAIVDFKAADPDLESFFNKAYGYAVFPSVGKAGMGVGGAYGKGIVYEQGKEIGTTTLKQLSMGFEFGGEKYREIIFFQDEKTLSDFKNGNYELGAQASAVALKKGAAKNADFDKGVAVFTQTRGGLMFDVSVGGQKFTFEPK
jgi:lipid-binding SYLF domain-containing protein